MIFLSQQVFKRAGRWKVTLCEYIFQNGRSAEPVVFTGVCEQNETWLGQGWVYLVSLGQAQPPGNGQWRTVGSNGTLVPALCKSRIYFPDGKNHPSKLGNTAFLSSLLWAMCKYISRRLWHAYQLIAGKIRWETVTLDVFWTYSLVGYRNLTEGKEINEHLSSQSSLFLSDFSRFQNSFLMQSTRVL